MNTQSKKSTQVFLGILSGIGIWLVGFLMSGRLSYVEHMELYPTGKLILAFPLVFSAACILIAKYSANKRKSIYYIASMISFFFPVICILINSLIIFVAGTGIPVISSIAEFFVVIFMIPAIPMFSIYFQIIDSTNTNDFAVIACVLFALVGMVISVTVYKKEKNRI